MDKLRGWVALVDQHVAGEKDDAFVQLAQWSYDDLELMHAYVDALAEVPLNSRDRRVLRQQISSDERIAIRERTKDLRARGDFDLLRKRAAILHTDVALMGGTPRVATPAQKPKAGSGPDKPQRRVDILSDDGRIDRIELANPHWELAMDLLEALPATPRQDPIVAQWYRAIGAYFANHRRYSDAMRHFEQARRVVADDAGVFYGEACLQETLGAPRIQDYVKIARRNGVTFLGIESSTTHYRRAEALLRKALAIDTDFVEANLRLGRVLTQLQKNQEALPYLDKAVAGSTDRTLTYYAHVFSADAFHALGQLDSARQAYAKALELFPYAQAARIGLGAVRRTSGDRGPALEAMLPALTRTTAREGDDPWWDYYFGDADSVDALLEDLRSPFRSARQ